MAQVFNNKSKCKQTRLIIQELKRVQNDSVKQKVNIEKLDIQCVQKILRRIFIYCDFTVSLYMLRIQLHKRKEMFYLMTHSTHYIYGYMASDIW